MQISEETIRLVEEALSTRQQMPQVTRGITIGSGDFGYNLEAPAKVIVPVQTPLVNMLPRRPGPGINQTNWKAITAFDTNRGWGTLSGNAVPTAVSYNFVSMVNSFHTITKSNSVDFEAQWYGRSFEGDVRARRMAELLYEIKMTEERWLINASSNLMVPPGPCLTTATSGGSIADSTKYWVAVTAVNGNGETTMSTQVAITTGASGSSANTITTQIFTVANATYYNVYVGTGATAPARTSMYLQTSVSGVGNAPQPSVNVLVAINGGGSTASGEVESPIITVTQTAAITLSGTNPPATNGAITFKDSIMWDGLIQQALLNTSTSNGLTLGSQVSQPAATNGVLALSDMDNLLVSAYNQAAADPDVLVMNSITHRKLTNLVAQANQTHYIVDSTQGRAQGDLTAQYRVTHYLNEATGKMIPIVVDRYCPAHTIVAVPMSIPYPVPEISNAVEVECNQEYWGVDFAVTNSSFSFADYVNTTLKVYFLGGLCVLRGITPAV